MEHEKPELLPDEPIHHEPAAGAEPAEDPPLADLLADLEAADPAAAPALAGRIADRLQDQLRG